MSRLIRDQPRTRVTVTAAQTVLAVLDAQNVDSMSVQIHNIGAAALTGFTVGLRATRGGTVPSAHAPAQTADFLTPGPVTMFASADPTTLAAGGHMVMILLVSEFESVELLATCATSTQVDVSAAGFGDVLPEA